MFPILAKLPETFPAHKWVLQKFSNILKLIWPWKATFSMSEMF